MNTASSYLTVAGIEVDVVYKDIKHLHIGVYPPLGRVRVAAPNRFDDDRVRLAVVQRLAWIKRQRTQLQAAERQSEREMVSGESHYVWGMRHRLAITDQPGRPRIEVASGRLVLRGSSDFSAEERRLLLDRWRRAELRAAIEKLISRWEPEVGVTVPKWSIRRMKTKWGSCNRESGHLWFNTELAKKHPDCLEYIVVHEMTHLLERGHGDRFTALMDRFLHDWRARRDLLNDSPLAAEEWPA